MEKDSLRLTLTVHRAAYPELFAEMKPLSGADRARRLQYLLRRGMGLVFSPENENVELTHRSIEAAGNRGKTPDALPTPKDAVSPSQQGEQKSNFTSQKLNIADFENATDTT